MKSEAGDEPEVRPYWKVTSDGAFWGGVLLLLVWGSLMGVAAYVVLLQSP
ncbi:hypothetical protein ACIRLA_33815 [Streptomyces sp. NPDC102364]